MPRRTTLYRRFQRIRDYDLRPSEVLEFVDQRWADLQQAKKILRKIKSSYLTEEELILLELKSMIPPKNDREIAEIIGIGVTGINKRKLQLYSMILSYGWWIQNNEIIEPIVKKRLTPLHWKILVPIVHRRTQLQVSDQLGITGWAVFKKMEDNKRLLRKVPDFTTFLRSLRMGYHD